LKHLIVNIAWNSRGWAGTPTEDDIEHSSFTYVREEGQMHEDRNFDLTRVVKEGQKYGFGFMGSTPRQFSQGEGFVFLASKNHADQHQYIVGCYGAASIGKVLSPEEPEKDLNISASVDLVVPFPESAHIRLDKVRHLQSAKRIAQGGFNYLKDATARAILEDALAAFTRAKLDTDGVNRLLRRLDGAPGRHPVWVLGPWPGINDGWVDECVELIKRRGATTVPWSWSLNPSRTDLREQLLEKGFRVGIISNGFVEVIYDIPPGGVVDQVTNPEFKGGQVPNPWPEESAARDVELPVDPKESRMRRLWFRTTRIGKLESPVSLDQFRDAISDEAAKPIRKGFRYAYPPEDLRYHLLQETAMPSSRILELRRKLDEKYQMVLYGPPGTGKTWLARQIAERGTVPSEDGKGEPEPVTELVTFHPSTSYEDFMEGIRPVLSTDGDDGKVRYMRRKGVFLRLCERAKRNPETTFYLIIDEINRGNIPAILGELITLMEKDKRLVLDPKHVGDRGMEVRLPYSDEMFGVPENVRVIGTMNTADRSIALMDVALRRRFRFEEVEPETTLISTPEKLDDSHTSPASGILGALESVATVLEDLNRRITLRRGRDYRIGHSYFLPLRRESSQAAFEKRFAEIWNDEVLPLLAEYFFDASDALVNLVGDKMVRSVQCDGETVFEGFVRLEGAQALKHLQEHLHKESNDE